MESKYLPGSQNSLQDVISTPPLWLAVTLVELVTRLDGDKKAKVSSGQNLHFCLQKMTTTDKRHASSPRLICLIKNCKAGTALQDGTGSLFLHNKTYRQRRRPDGGSTAEVFQSAFPTLRGSWLTALETGVLFVHRAGQGRHLIFSQQRCTEITCHFISIPTKSSPHLCKLQRKETSAECIFAPDLRPGGLNF